MMPFRLRSLSAAARLGLTGFVFVLLGGLAASVAYIYNHYHNRDEQPKLTMTDIEGAYHGVTAQAPLVHALQRGHPEAMPAKDREALLDWLLGKADSAGKRPADGNPKLFETYDNIDAGEANPIDLITKNCIQCHSRKATGSGSDAERAKALPVDQWEDVKKVAFPKQLNKTPANVLIISTHAHALALGTLGIIVSGLLFATRWARGLVGLLTLLMGVGLFADIGGWWVAQSYEVGVYMLIAGGAAFNGATVLSLLLILAELWLPRRSAAQ